MGVPSRVPGRDAGRLEMVWDAQGRAITAGREGNRSRSGKAAEQCWAPGAKCARRGPGGDRAGTARGGELGGGSVRELQPGPRALGTGGGFPCGPESPRGAAG